MTEKYKELNYYSLLQIIFNSVKWNCFHHTKTKWSHVTKTIANVLGSLGISSSNKWQQLQLSSQFRSTLFLPHHAQTLTSDQLQLSLCFFFELPT